MKTEMARDELLNHLKLTVLSPNFSREKMLYAIEAILSWLNIPENNTDENCRHVDHFVSYELMPERRYKELPDDIHAILFDMGATLHDTHTSPQVAENFDSTPSLLLARVRKLISIKPF